MFLSAILSFIVNKKNLILYTLIFSIFSFLAFNYYSLKSNNISLNKNIEKKNNKIDSLNKTLKEQEQEKEKIEKYYKAQLLIREATNNQVNLILSNQKEKNTIRKKEITIRKVKYDIENPGNNLKILFDYLRKERIKQ